METKLYVFVDSLTREMRWVTLQRSESDAWEALKFGWTWRASQADLMRTLYCFGYTMDKEEVPCLNLSQ